MKVSILALLVWAALFGLTATTLYVLGYPIGRLDTLPSQSEIQEALGLEPDGVIGPESRRVWDEVIERRDCDKAAMPIMEKFNKDFNKRYGLDDI